MSVERTWVLLHGTPLTPSVWDATAAHLRQPTHRPDLTVVPSGDDPQRSMAARVADDLSGDMDVVGHSFGGQVALELALLVPERVRTLTILCSRDTPYPPFAAVAASIGAGVTPTAEATLARWFSPAELARGGDAVESARRDLTHASAGDWGRAVGAIATYDSSARTPSLTMPVTLIAAGHDGVSTPAAMGELANRIPQATLTVEDAWSHMSAFTAPAALAERLSRARGAATR